MWASAQITLCHPEKKTGHCKCMKALSKELDFCSSARVTVD